MRTRRHSEDVASESYTARVDDANGTITREKKHLTQICVHKIGGSTLMEKLSTLPQGMSLSLLMLKMGLDSCWHCKSI